jgi:hypothetical protein|tara:strand:+ start:446 stop:1429 length:984 start_codon:yes stop_codon:yes gene_type:complete
MKNFFLAICITLFSLELACRVLIFFITFNINVLAYGFDKTIIFKVVDLSKFKFAIYTEKKTNLHNNKIKIDKDNKIIIWTFGGSTTEGYEPGCGHITSSWPDELEKLNPKIEIKNFAKAGSNSNFAIQKLFDNINDKEKPQIILWANKVNEEFNIKEIESDRMIILQRIFKTLKLNSLFFNLYSELIYKVKVHIFKIDMPESQLKLDITKFHEESIKNYNSNTLLAINLSKLNEIDFYIVSLFTKIDFITKEFYEKKFYKLWEKNAQALSKRHNIDYLDTQKFVRSQFNTMNSNLDYFCNKPGDFVHQTYVGNQFTAKIIYDYIFKN